MNSWKSCHGKPELSVEEAQAQVKASRARYWPANASCAAAPRDCCTRYLGDTARTCPVYTCPQCGQKWPWCYGGGDDSRCDTCATSKETCR